MEKRTDFWEILVIEISLKTQIQKIIVPESKKLLQSMLKTQITLTNSVFFCFITVETVYKSDFMKTRPTVCPAKIALESKLKGAMSNSKGKFNENTDFKGISP